MQMKITSTIITYSLIKFIIVTFLFFPISANAQLTNEVKQQTIDSLIKILHKKYVFPEMADSAEKVINNNYSKGKYENITTGNEFAFQLTRDLQIITRDQHLKISFVERAAETKSNTSKINPQPNNWINDLLRENNFGIKEKKILRGNIGYLNIPVFGPLEKCADTIIAAIKYVSNTDALIIDLRNCRGSLDENTLPFLHSYFFSESRHISDFYIRETNNIKQFWTLAWLPGKRYVDKPVYILTSGRTFSGGEAFAYDLQQHKRALVIGEITRGGANPTDLERLNDYFNIAVPYARSINTVTKTNWEHTGVIPDSLTRANLALYKANLMALQQLKSSNKTDVTTNIGQVITALKKDKPVFKTLAFSLEGYPNAEEVVVAGSFNFFSRKSLILKKDEKGIWRGSAEVEPGEISYSFFVDGKSIPDPKVQKTLQVNGGVNSIVFVK